MMSDILRVQGNHDGEYCNLVWGSIVGHCNRHSHDYGGAYVELKHHKSDRRLVRSGVAVETWWLSSPRREIEYKSDWICQ
jgi:hypothetical protein